MESKLLEKIIFAEHNFPMLFSNVQHTDYGMLFFNEEIKDSNDSNHAIITNNVVYDYNRIFEEIINFYEQKNIIPRIYSSLNNGQINKLENMLLEKKFLVEKYNENYWLINQSECVINEPYTLEIEIVDNEEKLIHLAEFYDNDWEFTLLKRKIMNKNYRFFTGNINGKSVTIGSIQYINDIGRIDDVETKEKYRGKGFSRQMIRHLVKYHKEINNNKILYLWYTNPIAGKIYREAGFIDFEHNFESWAAYKNGV